MKYILLVNQFSSAKHISARFDEYDDVYILSLYTVNLVKFSSYLLPDSNLFDEQIFFQSENIEDIIDKLGDRKFDYVINGLEATTHLVDQLSQYYTPHYANDIKTSQLRCDKFEMHNALAQNNLEHIKQIVYDVKDSLPKIESYGINYPCFVKPLAGSLTIGACKIEDLEGLKAYFSDNDKYKNYQQNSENEDLFLISELVAGEEILVDIFSISGKHYISTVQMYRKDSSSYLFSNSPIYLSWEVVRDQRILDKVDSYIQSVLDATKFKNGFAHTELFLLPEGEVKLIEINPRVSGGQGFISKISVLEGGVDQISLLMKYVFNYSFSKAIAKFYRCLVLSNLSGKPLKNLKDNLYQYKTVVEVLQNAPDGHIAKQSNNVTLSDAVAFVIIAAESLDVLEQDSQNILYHDKYGWE